MQTTDPIKAAVDVLNVVAVDPLNTKVRKLIFSINRITTFRSAKSEDILVLVHRFRELASTHLEFTNVFIKVLCQPNL